MPVTHCGPAPRPTSVNSLKFYVAMGTLAFAAPELAAEQRITPNFKDADITQIVEAVGATTGKTFIVNPRVRAQVTIFSSTPMSPDAFYQTFLAILAVHNCVAIPDGNVVKIRWNRMGIPKCVICITPMRTKSHLSSRSR